MKRNWTKILLAVVLPAIVILTTQLYTLGKSTDPDTFYHVRLSHMIWIHEPFRPFIWNYFTIFRATYMDHHWLFHIALSPFTGLLGDNVGLAIFLALQSVGYALIIWLILDQLKIKGKLFWILLPLIASSHFFIALNTGRAQITSLIFLLLTFWLLNTQKWLLLTLVSILYVLTYNGFPLILVPLGAWIVTHIIESKKVFWKPIVYITLGTLAGILFHPDFPTSIYFYFNHIVKIGLLNHPIPLGVGWSGYDSLTQFFKYQSYSTTVLVILLCSYKTIRLRLKSVDKNMILITIIFAIATLKARQFGIYWAAFSTITLGICIGQLFTLTSKKHLHTIWKFWQVKIGAVALLIVLALGAYQQASLSKNFLKYSIDIKRYENSSEWLKQTSQDKDIVFNSRWDQFPQLFYWNQKNYYVVGLDPLFMYEYDQSLYWKWRKITDEIPTAWTRETVYLTIKKDFGAKFVFLENSRNPKLLEYLKNNPQDFTLGFQDNYTSVFQVN